VQVDDNAPDAAVSAQLERALQGALESGIVEDATIAQSSEQARALWALRENIAEAQRRDGPNIKHDISVPVSAMARFLDDARRELDAAVPGVRFVTFGHLGDGNLHYNLAAPEGIEPESFLGNTDLVNRIVYDLVAANGGA
jgi:FAD/FMN-containing dehydrogenase